MKMPAAWLGQIMEKSERHFGLYFQKDQSADLLCRLKLRAEELHKEDYRSWIQHVAHTEWSVQLQQELLPALTVGETYFCRDPLVTQWLIQHWLPAIQSSSDAPIRLWSAGCCRGEEAYSLLFLLSEALTLAQIRSGLTMVATDINPEFIAKAQQGVYRTTSFRNGTEQFRLRYFSELSQHTSWQVKPEWRSLIEFQILNLIDQQPPTAGPFDLIFCRNVLMYFSPEQAQKTITGFLQQLNPRGLLLLNAVEAGIATQAGFSGFWAADNYALPASALTNMTSPTSSQGSEVPTSVGINRIAAADATLFLSNLPQVTAAKSFAATAPTKPQLQSHQPRQRQTVSAQTKPVRTSTEPSRQQQADYFLQQAKKSADLQQPEQARNWLGQLLELVPDSVAAYLLSAQLYSQAQQPQLALQALQKVIYLDPDLIVAHLLKAKLAQEIGECKTALKELQLCTQLLQHYPSAAEIPYSDHLSAGQLYLICQQLVAGVSS